MKKTLVVLLVLVGLFGLMALAQTTTPDAPQAWAELLMLVLSGTLGLPALWMAISGGVDWKALFKSGTVFTSLSGIFASAALYVAGSISLPAFVGAVYLAVAAIFLRNAVANLGK